jgi:Flp pilus assembly protein TadD
MPHLSKFVIFLSIVGIILLLLCSMPIKAHIEKQNMPDGLAEMEYRILLEFEPDNIEVRNLLGMVLYRQGKLAEAERELNIVLDMDPLNFNAIDAMGLVKTNQGKLEYAVSLFKKAIYLNPDDIQIYHHLGQALELLGDLSSAAEAYRAGLAQKSPTGDEDSDSSQRQKLLEALKNLQNKENISLRTK